MSGGHRQGCSDEVTKVESAAWASPLDLTGAVRDHMLRRPRCHPLDLTVAGARAVFAASPKHHLLLLVGGDRLASTVCRCDLDCAPDPGCPASTFGTVQGRTINAHAPIAVVHQHMVRHRIRRLAVVDDARHLLGLLCLKARMDGFCTDAGVEAMRDAR
ncbi:CBS domain-containing protein [Rhodococcoides fascians]|uniref:CBS domain-containing protein n=1 Tax=Rhodococcoides fascians TaxID=1828 RepID=UPI00050CC5F0|nr:CBS domain-containing protein [Rhodococcus fascians]